MILEVIAKISAVDNLTAPLKQMAAQAAAITHSFASQVNTFGQRLAPAGAQLGVFGAGLTGLSAVAGAVPAYGLGVFGFPGQAELDRLARHFQVVSTGTDEQRKQMLALADNIGTKLGVPQKDLLKSAAEVVQAGLAEGFEDLATKGERGVTMFERLATLAKGANEPLAKMAVDLATIMNSFNLPMGSGEEKLKSLERVMGLLMVAPRMSPDTPATHAMALREFGAIAAQLGMAPEEASALQNVLSLSGFPGTRGGMALKTILQRLLNPTLAAQQQMSLAGFNYGRVMKTDLSGMTADEVIKSLGIVGMDAGAARGSIEAALAAGDKGDVLRWKSELAKQIGDDLGFKPRDMINRGYIKRALDNVVATKAGGIDMVAFLEELGKMPVASFKDFAGLHHATKAAVLKFQESLGKYKDMLARLQKEGPGALDDASRIRVAPDSFGLQMDRLWPAIQALRNAVWNSGIGDTATAMLKTFNDALVGLSHVSPDVLKALGNALLFIGSTGAGLTAAGIAIGGIGLALQQFTRHPAVAAIIAAGGLAAYLGIKGGMFDAGVNDPGGLGVHAPGAGTAAFREFSRLIDNVADASGRAYETLGRLMGLDFGNSPLASGVRGVATALGYINDAFERNKQGEGWDKLMQGLKGPNPWADYPSGGLRPLELLPPSPAPRTPEPFGPGLNDMGIGRSSMGDANAIYGPIVERLNSPIAVTLADGIKAQLEGQGTVNVNVKVDGGKVTGMQATDDGKNIKLKTGDSMSDTNR